LIQKTDTGIGNTYRTHINTAQQEILFTNNDFFAYAQDDNKG
jgi:hypothetical protein